MPETPTTFRPGHRKVGGRRKGTPNKATPEIREAARQLVEDPAYRVALRRRLIAGKASHMETLLFHYAYGRPADRVEPPGLDENRPKSDLSRLTDEEFDQYKALHMKTLVGDGEEKSA